MKKIVHIGQMKSGTTYIQNTLDQNRSFLRSNGFLYPGKLFNQQHACYGICGDDIPWVSNSDKWRAIGLSMLDEIKGCNKDIIISSEALSCMKKDGVERFLTEVGGIDQVVVTVRNFHRVILSAWQQYIKGGGVKSLDDFIEGMKSDRQRSSGTWANYCFGETIKVWSKYSDVLVIVVGQESDPDCLIKKFCSELKIPELKSPELSVAQQNTSLKLKDVELLRLFNHLNQDMPTKDRESFIRWMLNKALFPASKAESGDRITLPPQYVEDVVEWSRAEVAKIPHGTKVVGDLSSLCEIEEDYVSRPKEFTDYEHISRANTLFKVIFNNVNLKKNGRKGI